jgi:hypothetical protein
LSETGRPLVATRTQSCVKRVVYAKNTDYVPRDEPPSGTAGGRDGCRRKGSTRSPDRRRNRSAASASRRRGAPVVPRIFWGTPVGNHLHKPLIFRDQWWAHKGSNLGPLPCEGVWRSPGADLPPELPGFGLRVFTSGTTIDRLAARAAGHKKYAGPEISRPAGACLLSPRNPQHKQASRRPSRSDVS